MPDFHDQSDAALRLTGDMDIYRTGAARQQLFDHLIEHPSLLLDLSETTKFDLTGLQLVCSARRSALEAGKPFQITGVSEGFRECAERYGLAPESYTNTISDSNTSNEQPGDQ